MRAIFALMVLALAGLCAGVAAAGDFSRGDAPAWVERLPVPDLPDTLRAATADGLAYRLSDRQISFDGDIRQAYYRTVSEVTDRSGLEEAAIVQQDYDPALEDLMLTHIDVIRGAEVIHLRDQLKEEVFRREAGLETGIIDGTLTVHLQLPDVRVGDIIDYGFLVRRKPPVPGTERGDYRTLEYGVPVALTREVVLWPMDWPLYVAPLPDRIQHSETPKGDLIRQEWRRVGHLPFADEDRTPDEDQREAVLDFGTWNDWAPVVAALTPYYTASYDLPPAWLDRLADIRRREGTPSGRAIAALRLVQDQIRYVGLEVGAGGYYARNPTEVATSGFGDCKDKALLLRTSLKALGIDSFVALANLDYGYGLPRREPGIGAFDHMIVRADLAGRQYWMDPTAIHEGGTLDVAVTPDYGYALALDGAADGGLARLAQSDAMRWQVDTTETFEFGLLGVYLNVLTKSDGVAANDRRRRWATTPVATIAHNYLSYYAHDYPGLIKVQDPALHDDLAANHVEVTEAYFLPGFALDQNGLRTDFPFSADLGDLYDVTIVGTRETPLYLGAPEVIRHHIKVRNAPISFKPPEPVTIDNDAFFYGFAGTRHAPQGLDMDWVYRTKMRTLAAAKVAPVAAQSRDLSDSTAWTWDLTPDDPAPAN